MNRGGGAARVHGGRRLGLCDEQGHLREGHVRPTGMPLSPVRGRLLVDDDEEEIEKFVVGMMPRLHKLRTKLHDGESWKEADYDMVFDGA